MPASKDDDDDLVFNFKNKYPSDEESDAKVDSDHDSLAKTKGNGTIAAKRREK